MDRNFCRSDLCTFRGEDKKYDWPLTPSKTGVEKEMGRKVCLND